MRLKPCPDCKQEKPVTDFGRNKQAVDGLHYYCRVCAAARQRTWAAANKEKVRRMRAEYLKGVREANANRDPYKQ